jgi:tetrahydromethanopterin S-methyltransferase subunit G
MGGLFGSKALNDLRSGSSRLTNLEAHVDTRITRLEDHVDAGFNSVDGRLNGLESRLDGRLLSLESRLDTRAGTWVVVLYGNLLAMLIAVGVAIIKL